MYILSTIDPKISLFHFKHFLTSAKIML